MRLTRGLDAKGHGILVPSGDGATSCRRGRRARKISGPSRRHRDRAARAAHRPPRWRSLSRQLLSSPPASVRSRFPSATLTAFREFVNMLTNLAPQDSGSGRSHGRRGLMSMDIFRDDALAAKSILVTGGGGGLGLEISKALAAKGAKVHICGRRPQVLEEAAARSSPKAPPYPLPTTSATSATPTRSKSMMDRDLGRGAADRTSQQRGRQFHRSHQGPQSTRLSRRDFDRHGRQLSCDARRRQALDRRRRRRGRSSAIW